MRKLLLLFGLLLLVAKANARQTYNADTTYSLNTEDTVLVKVPLRYQNCRRRSAVLALVLALWIPSSGQIYNKQYLKFGAIWLVATGAVIGLESSTFKHGFNDNTGSDICLFAILADAVYSIVDAPISASNLNQKYHLGKRRRNFSSIHISPNLINHGADNKVAAGFSLVLR